MKTFLFTVFALLTSSLLAEPSADLALAEQVVELTGAQQSMEDGFKASTSGIVSQLAKLGDAELTKAVTDATLAFFKANYEWSKLKPLIAQIYTETYTAEELQAIVTFYQSPAGKKMAAASGALNKKVSDLCSARTQEKMPAFQTELMQIMKAHMAKKGVGQ